MPNCVNACWTYSLQQSTSTKSLGRSRKECF